MLQLLETTLNTISRIGLKKPRSYDTEGRPAPLSRLIQMTQAPLQMHVDGKERIAFQKVVYR